MVVHAFPAAKLGSLVIKQISKPIANAVKNQAKSSPVFRKYVCLPPAQLYNWCEVKLKMWLLQLGQPVNITILNEAASIELGANLLGEGVIFLIAAGLLVSEYNRSSRKEAAKEAARKAEMQELENSLRDLFIQTEEQGAHIRELTRKVLELEPRKMEKSGAPTTPPAKQSPPPSPPSLVINGEDNIPPVEDIIEDVDLLENCKYKPLKGVVFRAVSDVEKDLFWGGDSNGREPGVIVVALNHLYKDVYRKPLLF